MSAAPAYYPKEGSGPRAVVDHLRQHPDVEFSSRQLSVMMNSSVKNVHGKLDAAVASGLLIRRMDGLASWYRWGAGNSSDLSNQALLQQVDHSAIARVAVIKLKGTMLGSVALAIACNTTPDVIDAALAPLVEAHKLSRISVLRSGIEMFDYRYSATWVPKDSDFEFKAPGSAPHPSLSAIAPPASKPVAPEKRTAPVPPKVTQASASHTDGPAKRQSAPEPHDALAAGAELGRKAGIPEHKAHAPVPVLGWQIRDAGQLDGATFDAATSAETVPNILEADDLVMALNSRGEFVIDLGGGDLVKFPPAQALRLKRFLDNTSVLEELAGQGAL